MNLFSAWLGLSDQKNHTIRRAYSKALQYAYLSKDMGKIPGKIYLPPQCGRGILNKEFLNIWIGFLNSISFHQEFINSTCREKRMRGSEWYLIMSMSWYLTPRNCSGMQVHLLALQDREPSERELDIAKLKLRQIRFQSDNRGIVYPRTNLDAISICLRPIWGNLQPTMISSKPR